MMEWKNLAPFKARICQFGGFEVRLEFAIMLFCSFVIGSINSGWASASFIKGSFSALPALGESSWLLIAIGISIILLTANLALTEIASRPMIPLVLFVGVACLFGSAIYFTSSMTNSAAYASEQIFRNRLIAYFTDTKRGVKLDFEHKINQYTQQIREIRDMQARCEHERKVAEDGGGRMRSGQGAVYRLFDSSAKRIDNQAVMLEEARKKKMAEFERLMRDLDIRMNQVLNSDLSSKEQFQLYLRAANDLESRIVALMDFHSESDLTRVIQTLQEDIQRILGGHIAPDQRSYLNDTLKGHIATWMAEAQALDARISASNGNDNDEVLYLKTEPIDYYHTILTSPFSEYLIYRIMGILMDFMNFFFIMLIALFVRWKTFFQVQSTISRLGSQ
jgi:hypothetical protein